MTTGATDAAKLQAEEYKDLGEYVANIAPVSVDRKIVPTASFGHRIRIAKLFESPEEFMYKIIQVAGWVRTARASGKEFMFVEVNDGSSLKGLQVSVIAQLMEDSCRLSSLRISRTSRPSPRPTLAPQFR